MTIVWIAVLVVSIAVACAIFLLQGDATGLAYDCVKQAIRKRNGQIESYSLDWNGGFMILDMVVFMGCIALIATSVVHLSK